jgi:fucose 4-O-acetylase-like acetyltransferase
MEKTPSRNTQIDCAKGALIILVVFGHLLEVFISSSATYTAIFSGIYVFHMPLFVFIAGMFSKSLLGDREYSAIFSRLLLPLVFFQAVYLLPRWAIRGTLLAPLLEPYWMLWFLLSLVQWKLALPLFTRMPFALPVSIALAILAGFDSRIGYEFSLSRSIYFFPFFLAGHLYGHLLVALIARRRVLFMLVFLMTVAGIACWSFNGLDHYTLYGNRSYAEATVLTDAPATGRLLLLGLSFIGSLGFLAWIPAKSALLSFIGQRTMAIFILHGFFLMVFAKLVARFHVLPSLPLLPVLLLLAVVVASLLAPTDAWLNRVFSGVGAWLTKKARLVSHPA